MRGRVGRGVLFDLVGRFLRLFHEDKKPLSVSHASTVIAGCILRPSYACKNRPPHSQHPPPLRRERRMKKGRIMELWKLVMHLMKPTTRYRVYDTSLPTIGRSWLRQLHNQYANLDLCQLCRK